MRQIYSLLILIVFQLNLYCQQDRIIVKDSAQAYYWDSETENWIYHVRYVYEYDYKGNLIESYWYNGISNPQILSEYHVSYIYDSSDNQIEEIWFDRIAGTNNWVYQNRIVRIFDSIGSLSEEIVYDWDSQIDDWKIQPLNCMDGCVGGRKFYQFDALNHQTELTWYDWDSINDSWVRTNNWRQVFTYDTNMNLIESCEYNHWNSCTFYTYDDNGNLIMEIYDRSSMIQGMDTIRYKYTYNESGNLTEKIKYCIDHEANGLAGIDRDVYNYDTDGYQTESYSYNWDSEIKDWYITWKYVYYWSTLSTNASKDRVDQEFMVYPNPFTDQATIKFPGEIQFRNIEIIDMYGRTVRSIDITKGNSITIQRGNLPSGIYLLRMNSDNKYIRKVIIR